MITQESKNVPRAPLTLATKLYLGTLAYCMALALYGIFAAATSDLPEPHDYNSFRHNAETLARYYVYVLTGSTLSLLSVFGLLTQDTLRKPPGKHGISK